MQNVNVQSIILRVATNPNSEPQVCLFSRSDFRSRECRRIEFPPEPGCRTGGAEKAEPKKRVQRSRSCGNVKKLNRDTKDAENKQF
jgi:hypothetical protein